VVNVPSININNPIYNQSHASFDHANDFLVDHTAYAYGIFVQDQIELPGNLFVLLGLRHDHARDRSNLDLNGTYAYPVYDYPNFEDKPPLSHRYGVLWRPVPELSLYTSYTENFGASAAGQIQFNGGRSPGETAQQYELGAKVELLDKRLTGSMSVYQLTKQNVLATDPVHGTPYVIPLGEVRSRGFEMDVTGEIIPRWNLILTYSYIDSRTTKADPVELLGRSAAVSYNTGSLWTTYAFNGDWQGLKLGGGVEVASSQIDYSKNTLPGYAVANLYASYGWHVDGKKITGQFNINNLFNKIYYTGSDNVPSKPLTALATLRVEF
jgi:iron complex outermembrane receptor protein